MFGFSKISEHAELVQRMSETLGVDLSEEMQRGNITPETLRETVLRCASCIEVGECQNFLADNHDTGADKAPVFCRNKLQLEAMRKE